MFEGYELSNVTVRASDLPAQTSSSGKGLLTATVVDSGNGKATLNIDGKTVTVETNAQLTPGADLKVMVKGFTGGKVQLQIVTGQTSANAGTSASSAANGASSDFGAATARPLTDLDISSRLMGFDIPDHPATLRIARALITAGMPVTEDTMSAIIKAAPQAATDQQIEFLVTLAREGIEPTREALELMPALERDVAALPKNMAAVFDLISKNPEAFEKAFQAVAQIKDSYKGALALENLENLVIAPETDSLTAATEKLQSIGKQFFTASEARLAFLDAFNASVAADTDSLESLAQRLASVIQLIPEENAAANPALDQAITSVADYAKNLPEPAPAADPNAAAARDQLAQQFNAVRQEFSNKVEEYLQMRVPGEKYFLIREAAADALAKLAQLIKSAPPAQTQGLLPEQFQQMPSKLDNLISTLQQQPSAPSPGAMQSFIAKLAADLAPLLSNRFNESLFSNTSKLLNDAAQLIQDHAQGKDVAQQARALLQHAQSQPAQQELELLANHLRDAGDLRASLNMLAQHASTAPDTSSSAINLARNLQMATLANLVAHNGAAPQEAFVTFFPIQVGDRVEIGKLKVYRNRENSGRKGGTKEIDPDNASLVIFLDTQFLGYSTIKINTFQRNLRCAIEVENKRLKKTLDKYLVELRDGLKNTPFALEDVAVVVRSRKQQSAAGSKDAAAASDSITTIDMRI